MKSKAGLGALFVQAAVGVLLVSCGGGGGGGSPAPAPSPPPPPPPAAFSLSGTVTAIRIAAVDSDTNDPFQPGRASNNTAAGSQPLGNPAFVVGYVNVAGAGPNGPNRAAGDIWDIFRVQLTAGQVVELNFGDPSTADIDLYLGDLNGMILAQSIGVSRSECIRIGTSGTYTVGVNAFSGFSTYELRWGPVALGTTCPVSSMSNSQSPSFVAGQILAKPVAGNAAASGIARAQSALSAAGATVVATTWHDGPVLLELNADAARARALSAAASAPSPAEPQVFEGASPQGALAYETAVAIKRMRASGQFEYVEENGIVQALQVGYGTWPPNDPSLNRMPHLDLIKLPDTFNALNSLNPRPAYQPIVAVLDTGIVADHPDLTRMLVPGFDFVSDPANGGDGNGIDSNPDDARTGAAASFHGTHVAGTIAAETFNGVGVVGVAPMARIMPVRVLGTNGNGSFADILQGILFAAGVTNSSGTVPARRADVINMSLGGGGACSAAFRDTIAQARGQGVIVVAATGNDGGAPVGTPANCAGVVAVSAIGYRGQVAAYSNVGPEVVVTAPGGDAPRTAVNGADVIFSTWATFGGANGTTRVPNYTGIQGTSMATPHVAGVMALMRAVNPNITPAQVDQLFVAGSLTDDVGAAGRDNQFGFGLINALKAINAAGGGGTQQPPVQPTLELSTTRLDFGSTTTQLTVTLTRINNSTDSPGTATDSAVNANAVTVAARANNPPNGPFVLDVTIDRALLATGEDVIQVELTSAQNRRLRFDVVVAPRTSAPIGLQGFGPVYVLALNSDTGATLAQANVLATTPTYPFSLDNLARAVVVVAGTDTDNDGFICGASEPCGVYPVLGAQPSVLSSGRSGVNFELLSGATSASVTASTEIPKRGFARLR